MNGRVRVAGTRLGKLSQVFARSDFLCGIVSYCWEDENAAAFGTQRCLKARTGPTLKNSPVLPGPLNCREKIRWNPTQQPANPCSPRWRKIPILRKSSRCSSTRCRSDREHPQLLPVGRLGWTAASFPSVEGSRRQLRVPGDHALRRQFGGGRQANPSRGRDSQSCRRTGGHVPQRSSRNSHLTHNREIADRRREFLGTSGNPIHRFGIPRPSTACLGILYAPTRRISFRPLLQVETDRNGVVLAAPGSGLEIRLSADLEQRLGRSPRYELQLPFGRQQRPHGEIGRRKGASSLSPFLSRAICVSSLAAQ